MLVALVIGTVAATIIGYLVGLIALRRTGIYFAMITVAIAEVFFFVEFNPLSDYTGGENGLPGVPTPTSIRLHGLDFSDGWRCTGLSRSVTASASSSHGSIVRSPVGAIFRAIRDNPLRATAVGHNIQRYKLAAFVIAAAYAGFTGGLLGLLQGFMPPDAFIFETRANSSCRPRSAAQAHCSARWLARPSGSSSGFLSGRGGSRSGLEARARRRIRGSGLFLRAWRRRRPRRISIVRSGKLARRER